MKEKPAAAEKNKAFWRLFGDFWKAKCERLKVQLNHAMIDSACKNASSDPQITPSTSASAYKPVLLTPRSAGKGRIRELLCIDIKNFNLSESLCASVLRLTGCPKKT